MAASEKEKMLAGEAYWAADPELVADRRRCRALLRAYNDERDENELPRLLTGLLGAVGDNVFIERPFTCDYGYNIVVGADSFINYGAVVLDVVGVEIGAHVKVGPLVQFLAADHPIDPGRRRADVESGRPIAVGDNVWIGGGAILCPGVTLGADSVIGAGSVVTRDIPAGVVAAGVPCRVIREL